MKFLSMIRIDEKSGQQPSERLMTEMGKLMEEATREGWLVTTLDRPEFGARTSSGDVAPVCLPDRTPTRKDTPRPSAIRLHRVFKTAPERLYKAFLDPEAMVKWLPPNGFTGKVHNIDARVG